MTNGFRSILGSILHYQTNLAVVVEVESIVVFSISHFFWWFFCDGMVQTVLERGEEGRKTKTEDDIKWLKSEFSTIPVVRSKDRCMIMNSERTYSS